MRWKSDSRRYGVVAVVIHWVSAAAVLALLVSGLVMDRIEDGGSKLPLLAFHAVCGVSVGLLTLVRVFWWIIFDRRPAHPEGIARWQARAAEAVHGLLYVVIFGMVGSGMALMVLSGAGEVVAGGGGTLPDFRLFAPRGPHGLGAWLLMALLAGHVLAAFYHQFVLRDGLIGRMR